MFAKDVMNRSVHSVQPHTTLRQIAQILMKNGISGVPVLDGNGTPIGMVSESDLIAPEVKGKPGTAGNRDWWLEHLAEGEPLSAEFLAHLDSTQRTAKDVMVSPVITVTETTELSDIAQLFITRHIKRLVVVRDKAMVGIVTRADLVRRMAEKPASPQLVPHHGGLLSDAVAHLDGHFNQQAKDDSLEPPPVTVKTETMVTAKDFNALVQQFGAHKADQRSLEKRAVTALRQGVVKNLLEHHVGDRDWNDLLHRSRLAAAAGETEMLLLRFPCELCSDGGRSINVPENDWPETLRGEAAEIYLFWQRDLKPNGFHLTAQVLDYPGGLPGDIGLKLVWG